MVNGVGIIRMMLELVIMVKINQQTMNADIKVHGFGIKIINQDIVKTKKKIIMIVQMVNGLKKMVNGKK